MKKIAIIITFAAVLFTVLQCSKEQDPSPKEVKAAQLTKGTWIVERVQNNNDGDLTSSYTAFAIAFLKNPKDGFEGDYYVAGGGRAFAELFGRWRFNENLTSLILDNGRQMEMSISDTTLTLSFTIPPAGGRVQGLSGQFTFTLVRV